MEVLDAVEELKVKLTSAVSKNKEERISKVIHKLSRLPMTIEILKATEIGKLVNNLRKWKGDIGTKSKELVKKWKMLLVEVEPTSRQNISSHVNPTVETEAAMPAKALEEEVADRFTQPQQQQQQHRKHSKKHRHQHHDHRHSHSSGPVGASDDQQVVVEEEEEEVKGLASGSQRTMKRNHYKELDEFSRALTTVPIPCKKARTSAGRPGGGSQEGGRSGTGSDGGGNMRLEVSWDGYSSRPAARPTTTTITTDTRFAHVERSPVAPPPHKEPTVTATGNSTQVAIGQSKRSRTQVYSGKKALSGPQVVTSLFDMCMKILIDNIDVIEDVGPGVPYHVLEPLLQRCTAAQLMKLEDFNPHLIEDTDRLWEKLVHKDFKGSAIPRACDWRAFYREKLEEREEKLKNLTSRIRANNRAREEPVRKVKLAEVSARPGRRSGPKTSFMVGRSSRGGFRSLEKPSQSGSGLMKKTMKMARERDHMMTFKLGK